MRGAEKLSSLTIIELFVRIKESWEIKFENNWLIYKVHMHLI